MAGIDYRTLAEWVGHLDGGVLTGRVYEHSRLQARKVFTGATATIGVMSAAAA
jgi:hypothetical protein